MIDAFVALGEVAGLVNVAPIRVGALQHADHFGPAVAMVGHAHAGGDA